MRAIPITVRVRPDTIATRAAVEEAFAAFIATIGDANDDQNASPIGARIEPSRISEAISAASGEYAHDLISPSVPLRSTATSIRFRARSHSRTRYDTASTFHPSQSDR
ncbi:MAG: hypothetical protein PBV01_00005 [Brucella anthropi]